MKTKSKIILLGGVAVVAASVPVALFVLNKKYEDNKNNVILQAKSLKFDVSPYAKEDIQTNSSMKNDELVVEDAPKFEIKNHFASEFAYASYYVNYSDNQTKEPALVDNSSYWNSIVKKNAHEITNKFTLINFKEGISLENFQNDYIFYYHSFANDFTGELVLRVYFEKKTDTVSSPATTSTEISKRKPTWQFVDYSIKGFKTINKDNPSELANEFIKFYNPGMHKFELRSSIRNLYLKGDYNVQGGYNSIDNLLSDSYQQLTNKIPTKKPVSQEEIEKAHSAFNSVFYISKTVNTLDKHAPKFTIDQEMPIWIEKVDGADKLKLHFYVKTYISEAVLSNEKDLNSSYELKIPTEQIYEYDFYYYKFKKLGELVSMGPLPGVDLSNVLISSLQFNSYGSSTDSHHVNTSNGYFNNLNIFFKNDVAISEAPYNLKLSYYVIKDANDSIFTNTGISKENAEFGTPIIDKNETEGKIKVAFQIGLKNSNTAPYIGIVELSGFKIK
ncbi:MAG1430 family protein [Mycoplasmopsis felifaucium]|uniref:MAG1430 family protein n=1 Tax=Mycoplasmopsis felifaucium TaxID=35768 RepID=UPI0004820B69|nr:hypothetical protein [Mycoplasmopsis felifaucium]